MEVQRTSSNDKHGMRLRDKDGVLVEVATGVCRFCCGCIEAEYEGIMSMGKRDGVRFLAYTLL